MAKKGLPLMDVRMASQFGRIMEAAYTLPAEDYDTAVREFKIVEDPAKAIQVLERITQEQLRGEQAMKELLTRTGRSSFLEQFKLLMPHLRNLVLMTEAMLDKPIEDCTQEELRQILLDDLFTPGLRKQGVRRVAEKYQLEELKQELDRLDKLEDQIKAGELDSEKVQQCRACPDFYDCPQSPLNGGEGHTEVPLGIKDLLDSTFTSEKE